MPRVVEPTGPRTAGERTAELADSGMAGARRPDLPVAAPETAAAPRDWEAADCSARQRRLHVRRAHGDRCECGARCRGPPAEPRPPQPPHRDNAKVR